MIHSSNHTIELGELHAKSALAEPALDELVLHDVGICPSKIEARTAVLRLHARRECSPLAQVNPSCCGMTVIGGRIPLLGVLWIVPGCPDLFDERRDGRFYGDLHRFSSRGVEFIRWAFGLDPGTAAVMIKAPAGVRCAGKGQSRSARRTRQGKVR